MSPAGLAHHARTRLTWAIDSAVAASGPTEAVLVSGFWRSGTTWLQTSLAQALRAKTIFEPLDPSNFLPLHAGHSGPRRGHIPLSPDELSPADWAALDRAFRGISPCRSGFAYLCRDSLAEAFRRRTVIKFVRAQMLLPALIARYSPRATLHLSRHPMAVIASLLSADWSWSFAEVSLPPSLLPTPLRDVPLLAPHQKIAALWAVTEQAALATPGVIPLRYDDMVLNPEQSMARLLATTGLTPCAPVDFHRDSPVTSDGRQGLSAAQRLTSWRSRLSPEIQSESAELLRLLWPEAAARWDLP